MKMNIDILDYLNEDVLDKIKKDLETSNNREIKDIDFLYSEIEIDVKWKPKRKTKKQLFAKAYDDWLCLCACVNGQEYEQSKREIEDWYGENADIMNEDEELYDVNFGVCAFTVLNEDGKAFISENSIEVYDNGDGNSCDCLGQFTIKEIMKRGGIN